MCLDFGTPYGFLSAKKGTPCYAQECPDKKALLAMLNQELAAGRYDDPAEYHPFLKIILEGMAANHARMNPRWSEPRYPFCDVIQAVGLTFGFANNNPHLYPELMVQRVFLETRMEGISWQVFSIVRSVVKTCVDEEKLEPWQGQMFLWLLYSGDMGMKLEYVENHPDSGTIISYGLVPGEQAPV